MQTFPRYAILVGLAIWAILSLGSVIRGTQGSLGGNDLYSYWYAGHFIRQNENPYLAFINRSEPELPVRYLDDTARRLDQIVIPGLVPAPGYTYPFLLFFTLFAHLSWQSAKWVWLIFNLGTAVAVIPLAGTILPPKLRLSKWLQFAFVFILLGASASRFALTSGQVAFFVLVLLLLAIRLVDTRPGLAGILLGLALSKYSLAAGVFLYFLVLEPKHKVIAYAVLVQLAGMILLIVTTGSSVPQVIQGYTLMFEHHMPMDGIHLASLFPGRENWFDILLAVGFTLVVVTILFRIRDILERSETRVLAISVMLSWSLLVAYHRAYDAAFIVVILYLILSALLGISKENISDKARRLGLFSIILSVFVTLLPSGMISRQFVPITDIFNWTTTFTRLTTISILWSLLLGILILGDYNSKKRKGLTI